MNRRQLVQAIGLCLTATASSFAATASPIPAEPDARRLDELIKKVRLAMLSMQRASWEQGVATQALLEWGDRDMTVLLARDAVVRQGKEGRLAVLGSCCEDNVTDPGASGEAVLYAAKVTGDPTFTQAAARMLDYLMRVAPRTDDGTICHLNTNTEVWSDSMYMAPPFLALAGRQAEAVRQVDGIRRALWNEEVRLHAHRWDAKGKRWADGDFWGVGNGWVAAGLVRVLKTLPPAMRSEKERLIAYLEEVIAGCMAHQRPDGLFHNVLDRPDTFVETNLAQMLAYSIYLGVEGGWLRRSHLAAADRMRRAAHAKVDRSGLVQGVCGSPDFAHAGTATEGQAFFILMEAAHRDLHAALAKAKATGKPARQATGRRPTASA
ncbi:MAG TPA: glycoside hydrolase family 88 protein [Burkholderiaceae bacterium]|nr:glycoside hydrolase family 88 protein [Burkholderiaceae bacterium]